MIDEQYMELIATYLEGNLTPGQQTELNKLIDQGTVDLLDIKEMERYYQKLGKLPSPEPNPGLGEWFYRMLEEEKNRQSPSLLSIVRNRIDQLKPAVSLRQIAFAASIFVVGMFFGSWTTPFQNYRQQLDRLSAEVSTMREVLMLNLLDNSSPIERIKAVNISTDIHSANDQIIKALLKTLNNDSNVNVRLVAIEALLEHASSPVVREGLINAISHQDSPLVQVALADAMLELQEKESVRELRELLDRDSLDHNVREKLQYTIAALT